MHTQIDIRSAAFDSHTQFGTAVLCWNQVSIMLPSPSPESVWFVFLASAAGR